MGKYGHIFMRIIESNKMKILMSSFLCLVMDVFRIGSTKILKYFFKGNVWLRGRLDSFLQNNIRTNKENVWLWGFVC